MFLLPGGSCVYNRRFTVVSIESTTVSSRSKSHPRPCSQQGGLVAARLDAQARCAPFTRKVYCGASGRTQQRHSQCSRSSRSCGRLGFSASAARRESISPPGLVPRLENTATPHPRLNRRHTARPNAAKPVGVPCGGGLPGRRTITRGWALGQRWMSSFPPSESRKQTSHRNQRLKTPGFLARSVSPDKA